MEEMDRIWAAYGQDPGSAEAFEKHMPLTENSGTNEIWEVH